MTRAHSPAIQALYVTYFNRPADIHGEAFWNYVVDDAKGSTAAVSAAFAASDEYKATFANMNSSAIVSKIYQNLFGHAPDTSGLSYWSELLGTGQLSVDLIVKNIADGAQGSDKTAFANKVLGAIAFTSALDTTDETAGYYGAWANRVAAEFIASITDDASLAKALLLANLDASTLAMVPWEVIKRHVLTSGIDALTGSAANDSFNAIVSPSGYTLQSGDRIDGGFGGNDRLTAEVSSSLTSALVPELVNIDEVFFSVVKSATSAGENFVAIDASRSRGVTHWESIYSERDLLIQGVRLDSAQSTDDVTIAMVATYEGNVDFGVYFDTNSLRPATNTLDVLRLQLLDTRSAVKGLPPVLDNPYTGVAFFYNGTLVKVESKAIEQAETYEQLLTAFQKALAGMPGLAGISAAMGSSFAVTNPADGITAIGTEIVLTASSGNVIAATGQGAGWISPATFGAGPYTNMSTLPSAPTGVITSSIILDNVGRGGIGGDLVVGTQSDALAGAIPGVERFDIEVRDSSKLQTINSTNNALEEVTIKNGLTSLHDLADTIRLLQGKGDLSVRGAVDTPVAGSPSAALPGSQAQHNAFGFSDVRVIDASQMGGKFEFTAEITVAAMLKYRGGTAPDTAWFPRTDYFYTGGANHDSMNVTIDSAVLAGDSANLDAVPTHFSARGGAGNDTITVRTTGTTAATVANLVLVEGGDGDDLVNVAVTSSAVFELGAGNDTVYAYGGTRNQLDSFDNYLTGGMGNDRIVLAGVAGAAPATRDWLYYDDKPFGNDTVLNFGAGGMELDRFDLRSLGGHGNAFAGMAISNANGAITIQRSDAGNDSVTEIAALYTDGTTASAHLFIAYAAHVGKVYTVKDDAGVSAGSVIATLVGTINLDQTAWDSLTAVNFSAI